jgi:hypothetical protein
MKLFDYMGQHNHEEVVFWADRIAGLKAIVPFATQRWGRRWAASECGPIDLKRKPW